MALATTEGCRVTALVALVVSLTRDVAVAATLSAQKASPLLVCESVTASPSQPSRSTIRAYSAIVPGIGKTPRYSSSDKARD
jgi:hypothetical protein